MAEATTQKRRNSMGRGCQGAGEIARSEPAAGRRLLLEIAVGKRPIQGRVTKDPGSATQFTGWLELAGLLESAREDNGHNGTEGQG
jgi:hypothetical protein